MDIKEEIKVRSDRINELIKTYLPKEEGVQGVVMEAMNYSVLAGGKRLRPMLMQETYQMFGGTSPVVRPFMAAIEMIHTYSLVHDDLPAMDDDEMRRGKKTTHVAYGEALGILAGDGLLNYAFETALEAFDAEGANCKRVRQALQVLAHKAGVYGMLGGQVVDVQNEDNPNINGELLFFIYKKKTAAMLESAMMIGAILAGASPEAVEVVGRAAGDVGVAFQIQDDILDVSGTKEELGKPVGSDEKNKKVTAVTLYGINAARQKVEQLTNQAIQGLEALEEKSEFLTELLKYLVGRRN